jgi:hypothetical protein
MWFRNGSLLALSCASSCIFARPIPSTSEASRCIDAFGPKTVSSGGCEDTAYICTNKCKILQTQLGLTQSATRSAFAAPIKTLDLHQHAPQDILYDDLKKASPKNKEIEEDGLKEYAYMYPWQQISANGTYRVSPHHFPL